MASNFRPDGDRGQVSAASLSSSAEVRVTCTAGTANFLELRRIPNFKERPRFSKWRPLESQSESLSFTGEQNALRNVRLNQDELLLDEPVDLDLKKIANDMMRKRNFRYNIVLCVYLHSTCNINNSVFMLCYLVFHPFWLQCMYVYERGYSICFYFRYNMSRVRFCEFLLHDRMTALLKSCLTASLVRLWSTKFENCTVSVGFGFHSGYLVDKMGTFVFLINVAPRLFFLTKLHALIMVVEL